MSPPSSFQNINIDELFALLQLFMKQHTGIVLEAEKKYLIEIRLLPFLAEKNILAPIHMMNNLDPTSDLAKQLISLFTTNETYFFRDPYIFEEFAEDLLPAVMQGKEEKKLRILSAACSSGQEAYSIAMQLHHSIPTIHEWDVQITGFDIDQQMIEKARSGWFTQYEANRGIPMRFLLRYCSRSGRGYEFKPHIRSMVSFEERNLLEDFSFVEEFDIIFFRNVMIYFDGALQEVLLRKMHGALKKEGALIVGATEILKSSPIFQRTKKRKLIWYQAIK